MALKTLPMLFYNMSGEMMYILGQRLRAQSVKEDKSMKVLTDIVGHVFSDKIIEEIFKSQEIYSRRSMRALFDRLAHMSIMRLNSTSMDKLYDLMTMAVKFQLQTVVHPFDVILITLNHFDGIRALIPKESPQQGQIDNGFKKFMETFGNLNLVELQLVRQTLLNFFIDSRIKVSVLLREKKQMNDGRFVIQPSGFVGYKVNAPGKIQQYEGGAATRLTSFFAGGTFEQVQEKPETAILTKGKEQRGSKLGTNMYVDPSATEVQGGTGSSCVQSTGKGQKEVVAKNELNLLGFLVGSQTTSGGSGSSELVLSLFNNKEEEKQFVEKAKADEKAAKCRVISIQPGKGAGQKSVEKLVTEMKVSGGPKKAKPSKGQELLDLMDSAE